MVACLEFIMVFGLFYNRCVCGYFQSSYGYELLAVARGQYAAKVWVGTVYNNWSNVVVNRLENLVKFQGRGILMIRNPFRAMLSFFRHSIHGFHSGSEASRDKSKENIGLFYTTRFAAYVQSHILKWRAVVEDWVTAGDILVVHYEDLVDDKNAELERMLDYLKIKVDKRRLECLKTADLTLFKRKTKALTHSPYSTSMANTVWSHIHAVDKLLVKMGHKGIPYHKYQALRTYPSVNVFYDDISDSSTAGDLANNFGFLQFDR